MPDKKEEVITALMEFIKRASQANATPSEVAVLPEVASVLLPYLIKVYQSSSS